MKLMDYLIKKGCMIMCSDFAVKSLIADWNKKVLGPNPFVNLGECSDKMGLAFKPS